MLDDGLELEDAYLGLCDLLAGRLHPSAWRALSSGVWNYISQIALAEGVGPLLFHKFKQEDCLEFVPESARQVLAQAYYASAGRNQLLLTELQRLLAALEATRVPVLVYKGGALAQTLYPDPALRPMSDLDLLAPPEHLERALAVLRSSGYQQQKTGYHVVLQDHNTPPIRLELHWRLAPGDGQTPLPSQEWLWQNRTSATFTPEAHLLVLAAHLVLQHGKSPRLIWHYDLHLLLKRHASSLDWPELIDQARRLGWAQALYQALLETRTLFSSPIPATVLDMLSASMPPQTSTASVTPSLSGRQANWTRRALAELPWRARLRQAWGLLFPAPAYLRWRYQPRPAWLWPLWYLIRWWKLAIHA